MSDWGTNFLNRFLEKIENMSDAELDQMMSQEVVYNVIKTPLERAKEIIEIYTKKKEEMEAGRDWMDAFLEIFRANPASLSHGYSKIDNELFLCSHRLFIREISGLFEITQHGYNFGVVESEARKIKYFYFFTHYEPVKYRTKLTLNEALEAVAEIIILGKSVKFRNF